MGIAALVVLVLLAVGSAFWDPEGSDDSAGEATSVNQADGQLPDPEEEAALEPSAEEAGATAAEATPTQESQPKTFLVVDVVDGDTLTLGNGKTVRIVGIDTAEAGACGYKQAANKLARLVVGERVELARSDENTDQYGRLLRYVSIEGKDVGLRQIKSGLAVARYDSRDGYGEHPREDTYIESDQETKNKSCAPKPTPKPQPFAGGADDDCMPGYAPCLPIVEDLDCGEINQTVQVTGSDPYRLDADGDGIGCDS